MPDPGKYDLNFRPNSYWEPEEEATLVGARIKGELRRKVALQGLAAGVADGRSLNRPLMKMNALLPVEFTPGLWVVNICQIFIRMRWKSLG